MLGLRNLDLIPILEVEVAMGLSVRESETGRLLTKDRDIEIATIIIHLILVQKESLKNVDLNTKEH